MVNRHADQNLVLQRERNIALRKLGSASGLHITNKPAHFEACAAVSYAHWEAQIDVGRLKRTPIEQPIHDNHALVGLVEGHEADVEVRIRPATVLLRKQV